MAARYVRALRHAREAARHGRPTAAGLWLRLARSYRDALYGTVTDELGPDVETY